MWLAIEIYSKGHGRGRSSHLLHCHQEQGMLHCHALCLLWLIMIWYCHGPQQHGLNNFYMLYHIQQQQPMLVLCVAITESCLTSTNYKKWLQSRKKLRNKPKQILQRSNYQHWWFWHTTPNTGCHDFHGQTTLCWEEYSPSYIYYHGIQHRFWLKCELCNCALHVVLRCWSHHI